MNAQSNDRPRVRVGQVWSPRRNPDVRRTVVGFAGAGGERAVLDGPRRTIVRIVRGPSGGRVVDGYVLIHEAPDVTASPTVGTVADGIATVTLPEGWDEVFDRDREDDLRLLVFLLTRRPNEDAADGVDLTSTLGDATVPVDDDLSTIPSAPPAGMTAMGKFGRAMLRNVVDRVGMNLTAWSDTDLLRDFEYHLVGPDHTEEASVEYGVMDYFGSRLHLMHRVELRHASPIPQVGGMLGALGYALTALDGWRRAADAARTLTDAARPARADD